MRFAYSKSGERIHIDDYDTSTRPPVYCANGHLLVGRKGAIRAHHYAHKPGTTCTCGTNKGEWHIAWQDRAQHQVQEIRCKIGSTLHIADIMIPSPKPLVIEIQHSPMDGKTMRARETFYTEKMKAKLVWVFDTRSWEYKVVRRDGHMITIRRRSGRTFPLLAKYTGDVTVILDFNKKDLLKVTSIKGSTITGTIMTMKQFDDEYLGTYSTGSDYRTFYHHI